MPGSALVWAAEAVRAASLNLCTDEYLLLLGEQRQIVSVSHLARDPRETGLASRAAVHPGNDGSLGGVIARRPKLVLDMGGRASGALAQRLGVRLLDLPFPSSPDEVIAQARQIARALGRPAAAEPYAAALRHLRAAPVPFREGAFLGAGGLSLAPDGLSARWLGLAGYRQPALPGNRLTLERLATDAPDWLIRSDYRATQNSRAAAWLNHPLVARLQARTIRTDGRPWTCGGLPMLAEIARLRAGRQ